MVDRLLVGKYLHSTVWRPLGSDTTEIYTHVGTRRLKDGPRQHSSAATDSKQHDQCDTEPENFKSVHGGSSGFLRTQLSNSRTDPRCHNEVRPGRFWTACL